jgi:hypothetical protein
MKIFNNKIFKRIFGFLCLGLLMVSCIYLDSIDYSEDGAIAGEETTFKLNVRVEPLSNENNERMVVAFLAPKSWDATNNTEVTYTNSIDEGIQTASLVPEDDLPRNAGGLTWKSAIRNKFGVGPNVLNDMEWVVFWTDKVYNVVNGEKITATFNVKVKTGPGNLRAKLGFLINNTGDGLSGDASRFKILYTDCFEVSEGEGAVTDFCELHFNFAQPLTATKNDILTIKFQGDIGENPLAGQNEIHLCATAYTVSGNSYQQCAQDDKTLMIKESVFSNTYSLSFWVADLFGIPEGEELDRIVYSFKNQDGSIEIMDGEVPFIYFFKCE